MQQQKTILTETTELAEVNGQHPYPPVKFTSSILQWCEMVKYIVHHSTSGIRMYAGNNEMLDVEYIDYMGGNPVKLLMPVEVEMEGASSMTTQTMHAITDGAYHRFRSLDSDIMLTFYRADEKSDWEVWWAEPKIRGISGEPLFYTVGELSYAENTNRGDYNDDNRRWILRND